MAGVPDTSQGTANSSVATVGLDRRLVPFGIPPSTFYSPQVHYLSVMRLTGTVTLSTAALFEGALGQCCGMGLWHYIQ